MRRLLFVPLLGLLTTSACNVLGPGEHRLVGQLATGMAAAAVELPDTATTAVPFAAVIWTSGGGCSRADGTDLSVEGRLARITPWDIHEDAEICPAVEQFFKHQDWVTFNIPGEARVVFNVRNQSGELIQIDRTVWIQEG